MMMMMMMIIIIIQNYFTLSSTQGDDIFSVLQNSWDIRTITTTVYYPSVLRTGHAYDRSCTNGIASSCQRIILHVPSVTRAYPTRRRRCKKIIKVTVKVLELVLERCSLREDEEEREEIWGLPTRLERDATYSVN
jgi:hypothetical protein